MEIDPFEVFADLEHGAQIEVSSAYWVLVRALKIREYRQNHTESMKLALQAHGYWPDGPMDAGAEEYEEIMRIQNG